MDALLEKVNSAPNTAGLGGIPGLFGETHCCLHFGRRALVTSFSAFVEVALACDRGADGCIRLAGADSLAASGGGGAGTHGTFVPQTWIGWQHAALPSPKFSGEDRLSVLTCDNKWKSVKKWRLVISSGCSGYGFRGRVVEPFCTVFRLKKIGAPRVCSHACC